MWPGKAERQLGKEQDCTRQLGFPLPDSQQVPEPFVHLLPPTVKEPINPPCAGTEYQVML